MPDVVQKLWLLNAIRSRPGMQFVEPFGLNRDTGDVVVQGCFEAPRRSVNVAAARRNCGMMSCAEWEVAIESLEVSLGDGRRCCICGSSRV